jgi:hypothetical protein
MREPVVCRCRRRQVVERVFGDFGEASTQQGADEELGS